MSITVPPERTRLSNASIAAACLVLCCSIIATGLLQTRIHAQAQGPSVTVDPDDIGGVVRSPNGPEAGVWVIAETTDLPTRLIKIVVTDDQGRFVVPDLPKATYQVWVRGYGLVDSKPIQAAPGKTVALTATPAATAREAAKIYPGSYWFALLNVPQKGEFPGTGPQGNGMAPALRSQAHWIDVMKQGCHLCHQLGNKFTRELETRAPLSSSAASGAGSLRDGKNGPNPSSMGGWDRRVQSSQRGAQMSQVMSRFGRQRGLAMFADWSDRIAAGEFPPEAPPRPQGAERNLVLTLRDWGTPTLYIHDEITTDKRNPTVNPNGPAYGVAISDDFLTIVDPVKNTAANLKLPTRDDPKSIPPFFPRSMLASSPYYGDEILWTNPANPHNPMMDGKGRVWLTHRIRAPTNPAWCREGSSNPYAKNYPIEQSERHPSFYDPTTQQWTLIDTCFGTHHLQFAEDKDDTLYFSGDGEVIGWINTRKFDETRDAPASQGWCPVVVDTNGDGRIGEYVQPAEPVDPKRDKRYRGASYGIIVSPVDHAVWFAQNGPVPGRIFRLEIGSNPPATCKAEVYEVPFNPAGSGKSGFVPRGIDIDRNGVVWTALSGSGHMASFDRRKCAVLNGPTSTGEHCQEGWTLYKDPGPTLRNAPEVAADYHYYNWVDQFDTLGLGKNVPLSTGSLSDSLLALLPDTGQWVVLRVPYPLGFFSRGMDGRIDDAKAGWKGKGVWATYGAAVTWHIEGGKGTNPKMIHFQMRPHPLAR
ncbi:MAG: carboxypeptidase regulatory-like domain-containing protein [Acidobacteria bacterium]|nr:carboxypeptidase regulatory-like domain-containing protein [Acidobacteriota bacterium]